LTEQQPSPQRPDLTTRQWLARSATLTVILEVLTCISRFGLGLQSTRDTASTIGVLTCGIRIHHGYIGVVMLMFAVRWWHRSPVRARYVLLIAIALIASDLIHHFLVL
jgi:hypothetical protein